MLTTGLGQPQESIPRGSREIEPPTQTLSSNVAAPIAAGTPTDCPVCGDVEAEPIAVCSDFHQQTAADAFLALRCIDCGTVYISPAAVPADHTRSRDSRVTAELSGVGRRIVQSAVGTDPSRILVLQHDSTFDPGPFGPDSLRLIVLDGTLEYSQDPSTLLAALRGVVQPGNQIVLILKNLGSPSFAIFGGRHWEGYDVPGQRALYSIEGVQRLAGRVGLEVRSTSTVSDAGCWVESCRRALYDWQAPAWLIRRFGSSSIMSRFTFGLLEGLLRWRGSGGILVVPLTKASDATTFSTSPPRSE